MREKREEAKYAHYHRTLVRIHFPNKIVLQGLFRLKEPVGALYAFVASNLASPSSRFYLYLTPPRQDLKDRSETMIKAGLVPAANVYVGSKTDDLSLSTQCLARITADRDLQSDLERLGRSSATTVEPNPNSEEEGDLAPPAKRPTTDAKGKSAGGAGGKMPKWFAA